MPIHNLYATMGELRQLAQPLSTYISLLSARPDDARPREDREVRRLHILRDQVAETGLLKERLQIVQAAPASRKTRCPACALLPMREVGNDQPPPRFEHAGDFGESLAFEGSRQMVHHQGGEDHIKGLIGKRDLLDDPNLEFDGHLRHMPPCRFRTGAGDLLTAWIDARDASPWAEKVGHF